MKLPSAEELSRWIGRRYLNQPVGEPPSHEITARLRYFRNEALEAAAGVADGCASHDGECDCAVEIRKLKGDL